MGLQSKTNCFHILYDFDMHLGTRFEDQSVENKGLKTLQHILKDQRYKK